MNATIKIEKWVCNNYGNIEIIRRVADMQLKHKVIIKQIKKIIRNKKFNTIFIHFTIINHSEKKVEYISKDYKLIMLKDRYIAELGKEGNNEI